MKTEKSKNIFENSKNGTIGARIRVLLAETGLSVSAFEDEYGIGNGTLKSWKDESIEKSTNTIENFLNRNSINPKWWKTGTGPIFLTHEHNEAAIPEKPLGDDLDGMLDKVEASPNYFVIPKVVLRENYRLVAIEQYQIDREKLEKEKDQLKADNERQRIFLDAQIEANKDLSRKLDVLITKLAETQKSQ